MRKINKKISLGLAICLLASPVVTNLDTAYAQEIEESVEEDTLTFEDFKKEFEEFKKTDAYNFLDDEKKKNLEEVFSSINEENFGQENYDKFQNLLNSIEISYLSSIYNPLYEEVGSLNKESLSDELKEEIGKFEPSYESKEDYENAIEEISILKDRISAYKKNLDEKKALLKKGLDSSKEVDIDLEGEKKVLANEDAKLTDIEKAIESFNKKVNDYNKALDEKRKSARKDIFAKLDKDFKELKENIVYKKSSEKDKKDLGKIYENVKKSYEENKEDFESLKDSFYKKAQNLDGNSFIDLLKEITEKLEKEDKLSDDKKEYYVNKINKIREEGSVENIEELQNLKKELDKDLENKGGSVNEITVTKVSSDNKKGKNKKSRSIVRTGIKSVGVVGLVAVVAGGAYYFLSKKDK